MIRRPPRSTQGVSSAASDVYKRQRSDFYLPEAYTGDLGPKLDFPVAYKLYSSDCMASPALTKGNLASTVDNIVLDRERSGTYLKVKKFKEYNGKWQTLVDAR